MCVCMRVNAQQIKVRVLECHIFRLKHFFKAKWGRGEEKPERRGLAPISVPFCRVSFPLPITAPLPSLYLSVAFSLHPKHLTSPFCPSSIFHLDIPDSYLCILPPSSPLPCKGTGSPDEWRAKPEPKSIRHPFALSPTPPSLSVPSLVHSPLLLSSPWLVAARIGALLHALRWRAHTVGLLQLN